MSNYKFCYNCSHYKPYYTKGYTQFDKCELGYCREVGTVEKHHTCPKFSYKNNVRIGRKQAALKALTEHVNALSEIKQILEEDDEDMLEQFLEELKEQKKRSGKKT